MYFRINKDRFKMSSVSRFSRDGQSIQTKKYYLTIWFGKNERKFAFDTEKELDDIVNYLDNTFKVSPI
jgi:hypothetical protein